MTNNHNRPAASLIELLPTSAYEKKILNERAKKLAVSESDKNLVSEACHYVEFRLGDDNTFGIPNEFIKEIISNTNPTHVPYANHYTKGVINRYGALISVIDLKKYFKLNDSKQGEDSEKSSIIVISGFNINLGLSVDYIQGSSTFETKNLSSSLQFDGAIPAKYVLGIHKKNIAILNIDLFLNDLLKTVGKTKEAML